MTQGTIVVLLDKSWQFVDLMQRAHVSKFFSQRSDFWSRIANCRLCIFGKARDFDYCVLRVCRTTSNMLRTSLQRILNFAVPWRKRITKRLHHWRSLKQWKRQQSMVVVWLTSYSEYSFWTNRVCSKSRKVWCCTVLEFVAVVVHHYCTYALNHCQKECTVVYR